MQEHSTLAASPASSAQWSRPMRFYGCSDAPARPGTTRYPQRGPDVYDRTEWQLTVRSSII
jgi:hypothetical protein